MCFRMCVFCIAIPGVPILWFLCVDGINSWNAIFICLLFVCLLVSFLVLFVCCYCLFVFSFFPFSQCFWLLHFWATCMHFQKRKKPLTCSGQIVTTRYHLSSLLHSKFLTRPIVGALTPCTHRTSMVQLPFVLSHSCQPGCQPHTLCDYLTHTYNHDIITKYFWHFVGLQILISEAVV